MPKNQTSPEKDNANNPASRGCLESTCCVSSEPLHVYDWLDQPAKDEGEKRAKEWLEQFVKPAMDKDHDWLNARRLTCEYEGKRYRCIGASSLGDVWITSDMRAENGYEKRVDVESLSSWELVDIPRRRSGSKMAGILAVTAMLAGSHGFGIGGGRSSYAERHDPNRPKTPEDLKHMEDAQRKRDRKAARRNSSHNA